MIELLMNENMWDEFYRHKTEKGILLEKDRQKLEGFIRSKEYMTIVEKILQGESFSTPRKVCISKMHSQKKRIVYVYEEAENYVLKGLTYLLQKKYDFIFADNLYSFRPGTGVKDAIYKMSHVPDISKKWSYKVDISNYFNSVPVGQMLDRLKHVLAQDEDVYLFLEKLLNDPYVLFDGKIQKEEKGIMAGTPISTFLANVYLAHMDHYFREKQILYARYSDDIIVFEDSEKALKKVSGYILEELEKAGLAVNLKKECMTKPGEQWTFLGVCYQNGKIDVSPVSVEKLKAKMSRKTRVLMRWKVRNQVSGEHAAKAFIRVFNKKLFENDMEHELTWARWYFPLINTTDSLKILDKYSQDCIRYLATGKRTKSAYNFRYADMKEIGYISLVNRYYNMQKIREGVV